MEPELERRCDPEIAAAAAQAPEQVRLGSLGDVEDLALGGHEFDRHEVVDRQAVRAHEPAEPAAEGQPGNAGRRDDTAGRGEVVDRRLAVELAPGRAALDPHRPRRRVDDDPLHRREVDENAAAGGRPPGDAVTAAPDGDLEAALPAHGEGCHDVRRAAAPQDQRRSLVEAGVVDASDILVAWVPGSDHLARERRVRHPQLVQSRLVRHPTVLLARTHRLHGPLWPVRLPASDWLYAPVAMLAMPSTVRWPEAPANRPVPRCSWLSSRSRLWSGYPDTGHARGGKSPRNRGSPYIGGSVSPASAAGPGREMDAASSARVRISSFR